MNGLDERLPFSFFSLYFILPTTLLEGNGCSKEVFGAILLLRRAKLCTSVKKTFAKYSSLCLIVHVAVFFCELHKYKA
jgi:hypothetical protein